jgi:hypothetical protein
MKEYCFTVECGSQTITVIWVTREFKYLVGKQCPEGSEFIQAVGTWDTIQRLGTKEGMGEVAPARKASSSPRVATHRSNSTADATSLIQTRD